MSYGIYVGKNCTADGSVFLAGYGNESSSHWLEIVPRRTHAAGATIAVGATEEAKYSGESMDVPQVPETAKYITTNYSDSYYANTEAMNGLRLVEALSASIEARTKALYGIRQPGRK